MITSVRKLTKDEKKRLKALAVNLCANYDCKDSQCFPEDAECRMVKIACANECCAYFQKAVLPLEPALLEALTTEFNAGSLAQKECAVCGAMFFAVKNQVYCSVECRKDGEREMIRKRVALHRRRRRLAGQ